MPLRILKIAVSAATVTSTNPEVERFFHTVPSQVSAGTYTILVEDFETDTGDAATELPELAAANSYYNVYINGVLQMEGITSYTPGGAGTGQLVITVGTGETIEANTPIVLEVVNFAPVSDTEVIT
jgi:hypothetical protein